MENFPSFNLWHEPWITCENRQGALETVSIEQLLLNAAVYRTLFDPSPLVIVSIHRLLVAILQDIFQPQDEEDLIKFWNSDGLPPDKIEQFGTTYAHRFDLFSVDEPFLQSADIPLFPEKKGQGKSVGYLLQEQTAGTAVTHYNHTYDADQILCAVCCTKGLLAIPAFASSGGAGIKPSINGVPPIYIIPGGETYYHSLIASLVTPYFQPDIADKINDTPWWRHNLIVGKKEELLKVGYLHSLTFPARRVRLHPERMNTPCSRCGETTQWGAGEMVYEMGESRPKEAAFWQDPFAAYRRKEEKEPIPIRPLEGKAIWREFNGLFLPQAKDEGAFLRPRIIGQLEAIRNELPYGSTAPFPFQTIGLRTDMKMKIFEWESNGFLVPPNVLTDPETAVKITAALNFATKCEGILKSMYQVHFSGSSSQFPDANPIKGTTAVKNEMLQSYWQQLGDHFQQWILRFTPEADLAQLFNDWLQTVLHVGTAVFRETADQLNTGTSTALICEAAINHCRGSLYSYRNKTHPQEEKHE